MFVRSIRVNSEIIFNISSYWNIIKTFSSKRTYELYCKLQNTGFIFNFVPFFLIIIFQEIFADEGFLEMVINENASLFAETI